MPIGRQLHDIVVPQLFVLTTGLTALHRCGTLAPDDQLVRDLVETATQTLADLRAISRGQVATEAGSLRDVAERLRDRTRTVVHLTDCEIVIGVVGNAGVVPALVDDLVAFAWEAVANAIRHGGATSVDVELRAGEDSLIVVAKDNGNWCEPTDDGATGLCGLERRAARWGGRVTLSHADQGTRLEWCVPLIRTDIGNALR